MAPPSFVQVFDDVWIAGKHRNNNRAFQFPFNPHSAHACTALHTHPDPQPTNQHTPIHPSETTGLLSEADVAELSPQFKGWLYLNTDVDGDEGMYLCGCVCAYISTDRHSIHRLTVAWHATPTPFPIQSIQPFPLFNHLHPGAPGGFPTVAAKHPGAQHVAVNNKELSLALASRLMAALDGMPRPLLISCRCVSFWVLGFGFWFWFEFWGWV